MTAQQLRDLSNTAHWAEGAVIASVAVLTLLEAIRGMPRGTLRLTWPLLIVGAALFLPGFILATSEQQILDAAAFMWRDPQQRQHLFMAAALLAAGVVELWLRWTRSNKRSFTWPVALVVLGTLLMTHTEYGTAEAVRWATRQHIYQGIMAAAAGGSFAAARMGNRAGRLAAFIGPLLLLATSVMLLMYREPAGAYEPPAF